MMSENAEVKHWYPSLAWLEATRVPFILGLGPMGQRRIPTLPDTSSPWSDDCAHNGWSARMFLHQLLQISTPHLMPSDTERLLSDWMPWALHVNPGSGTMLSDVILPLGQSSRVCFRTAKMVRGLIRRALARGRSLRVLLRTEHDTIPVIVTFGSHNKACEFWTIQSGKPLPASLRDGLLEFLMQHVPECTVIV